MKEELKLQNQVCFPLYSLSREITNHYRPLLEEINLTYPQYLVMMILWEEKTLTVNEIGKKLFLDSGTLTPLLKRLQLKGFVVKERKKTDERVVEIKLSDLGNELQDKAAFIPEKLMKSMDVTYDELILLKKIVLKIINKAKQNQVNKK